MLEDTRNGQDEMPSSGMRKTTSEKIPGVRMRRPILEEMYNGGTRCPALR